MYKRGEIVLVPVPFSDLSAVKKIYTLEQSIALKSLAMISNNVLDRVITEINKSITNEVPETHAN